MTRFLLLRPRSARFPAILTFVALAVATVVAAANVRFSHARPAAPVLSGPSRSTQGSASGGAQGVAILAYHRFGATVPDSMTIRTATFRWQLDYLQANHHPVVPLRTLISFLQGRGPAPPPGAVVITIDDGHRSVFEEALPAIREYKVPVTLFIYPSAISNAAYALTWEQLGTLRDTGLFDIQSHTYWHPNFKIEKRRQSPAAYQAFVTMQFVKPKTVLEKRLGVHPDLLAWPFGIHDDELIRMAREVGYAAGVTLDHRLATPRDQIMALPRFLITESTSRKSFISMLPRDTP
jgi:peptidoglycan/xylan/chitin deacetylase (PgdA/CDA1 family)